MPARRYAALGSALSRGRFLAWYPDHPRGGEIVVIDLSCTIRARIGFTDVDEIGRRSQAFGMPCRAGLPAAASRLRQDRHIDRAALADSSIGQTGGPLYVLGFDSEAAIGAERALGIGDPEGGLVTILIDGTVRAGLLIGGRPFRGIHGLAGQIERHAVRAWMARR